MRVYIPKGPNPNPYYGPRVGNRLVGLGARVCEFRASGFGFRVYRASGLKDGVWGLGLRV